MVNFSAFLRIMKLFKDGREEVMFDDHNIVTSGIGVSLASMFSEVTGSLDDYKISYFQLGVNGSLALQDESTSQLGESLTISQYGGTTNLDISNANLWDNGSTIQGEAFVKISSAAITKLGNNQVQYKFLLGPEDANGQEINELGLFSGNPLQLSTPARVMCAYRFLENSIVKSDSFSLLFQWTLEF